MTSQSAYRAFVLDKEDHIVRRYDFEAENHDAALKMLNNMWTATMSRYGNEATSLPG
jgi:hypothetical protein